MLSNIAVWENENDSGDAKHNIQYNLWCTLCQSLLRQMMQIVLPLQFLLFAVVSGLSLHEVLRFMQQRYSLLCSILLVSIRTLMFSARWVNKLCENPAKSTKKSPDFPESLWKIYNLNHHPPCMS